MTLSLYLEGLCQYLWRLGKYQEAKAEHCREKARDDKRTQDDGPIGLFHTRLDPVLTMGNIRAVLRAAESESKLIIESVLGDQSDSPMTAEWLALGNITDGARRGSIGQP